MNVTGKISKINEVETGETSAGKSWSKQSIVIDNGEKFNPLVCISFFGDKSDLISNFKVGNTVEVGINLSSREFNGKWYHNVDGWRIALVDGKEVPVTTEDDQDYLPF